MSDTFVSAMAEMRTMLINLDISNSGDTGERGYTCFDLIDALEVARMAVLVRANDNPNQYTSDADHGYPMLYNSIMEDIKEAIRINHRAEDGRTQQFVTMFNNLVVEKMMIALRALGPSDMAMAVEQIVSGEKAAVFANDVPMDEVLFQNAQEVLRAHNKQRLERIQTA